MTKEKINAQNSVASSASNENINNTAMLDGMAENKELIRITAEEEAIFDAIDGAIWDILNDYDTDEYVEIYDGWALRCANPDVDSIWAKGVTLGKIDCDGDFIEECDFVLDDYACSFADLLEGGKQIVDCMVEDIYHNMTN